MLKGQYKIIRDKSLKELQDKYERVLYKKLDKKEFRHHLKLRLKEETLKLLLATDKNRQAEKIAEILEVTDYIIKEEKIDKSEILKIKNDAKKKKGGFDKQYLLISLEE